MYTIECKRLFTNRLKGTSPVFARFSTLSGLLVQTDLVAEDGATLVLGGLPRQDDPRPVYLFLTPRILAAQGRPLSIHDFRGAPAL